MNNIFRKNHFVVNIVAGICCLAMLICDISLFERIRPDDGKLMVINERHDMEKFYADGEYKEKDSDSESAQSGEIVVNNGRLLFNILEIVPTEKKGIIGYMIGGCEPFPTNSIYKDNSGAYVFSDDSISGATLIASVETMKAAHLDAMINKVPGSNDSNSQNVYMNGDIYLVGDKYAEGNGNGSTFAYETGKKYDGCYKYVGAGKGVYAKATSTNGSDDSVVMVSKYYSSNRSNDGHFDYIFVYGEAATDSKDIAVTNHRRVKVTNRDKFFIDCYPVSDVADWKSNHKISVVTRSPQTLTDKDIEDADMIFINNGNNMDYFKYALKVQNRILGNSNLEQDNNVTFSSSLDLTFPQVVKIYDRVVAKEDVAFVASKNCINGTNFDTNLRKLMCMLFFVKQGGGDYGSGRRLFMDYFKSFVERGIAPSLETTATSNAYNGLTEKNGYMYQDFPWETDPSKAITDAYYNGDEVVSVYGGADAAVKHTINGITLYRSKSNTTDYMYIDEQTGSLKIDKKYSGKWYNVDFVGVDNNHPNGFDYKKISWNKLNDEYATWPWDHSGESGALKIWQFPKETSDNGNGHLPLYYQYVGWGDYKAVDGIDYSCSYRNQSIEQENDAFKGDIVKRALDGREVKREENGEGGHNESGGTIAYYISANILNGDGVGNDSSGKPLSKVLYYNQYEIDSIKNYENNMDASNPNPSYKSMIPLLLQVRTTCNIDRIELYSSTKSLGAIKTLKNSTSGYDPATSSTDTLLKTYTPTSVNNVSDKGTLSFSGGNGLSLMYTGPTDDASIPKHSGNNIYQFDSYVDGSSPFDGSIYDITLDKYKNKMNATFIVKVVIKPVSSVEEKFVTDEISFVRRDFFLLN